MNTFQKIRDHLNADFCLMWARILCHAVWPERHCFYELSRRRDFARWKKSSGAGGMPHAMKAEELRKLARQTGCVCFVETGTHLGDTLYSLRDDFEFLYSIEVSPWLARQAQRRLASFSQVEIAEGDSGKYLELILPWLTGRTLFYLDGHYSRGTVSGRGAEETPVLEELEMIFNGRNGGDWIVIDDARLFDGTGGYPALEEIREYVKKVMPMAEVEVILDQIRIGPVDKNVSSMEE